MVRPQVTLAMLLALAFGLTSCSNDSTPDAAGNVVHVSARTIGSSAVLQQHAFSGTIEGNRKVALSTKLMGQITAMPYDVGTRVSAGQVVVRINSDDLRAKRAQIKANALEAQAAFKNAEVNRERLRNLYARNSASQKELDDVETMYQMASAKVSAVKEMENEINDALGYGELRSPINGYIVARMAEQGDIASPGMPILVIEDLSVLKIVARVPGTDIHLFKKKDSVRVRIDALADDIAGTVEQINPSGNPMSRQFDVKIALAGTSTGTAEGISSGMYAQVIMEKGTARTITVPESALVARGQLAGVFVMSDRGTAMLRWIRTGSRRGEEIEVLSGLRDGERVILSDTKHMKDGQKVEVAN